MSRTLILLATGIALLLLAGCFESPSASEQGAKPVTWILESDQSPEDRELSSKWEAAAAKKSDWDYRNTKLSDVAQDLFSRLDVPFEFDQKELDAAGISTDQEVTFVMKNTSAGEAVRQIFGEFGLSHCVRNGRILLTDRDSFSIRSRRLYFVEPLLTQTKHPWKPRPDFTPLVAIITSTVHPDSWSDVGGIGEIQTLDFTSTPPLRALQIKNSPEVQQQVEQVLRGLFRLRDEFAADARKVKSTNIDLVGTAAMWAALEKRESREFDGSLQELADQVEKAIGKPVLLSFRGLEEAGVDSSLLIQDKYVDLPLSEGLNRVLAKHGLGYYCTQEALVITSQYTAESAVHLEHALLPVYDLIAADSEYIDEELLDLRELVMGTVRPDQWDDAGGPASLSTWEPPALVVSAPHQQVREVEELLSQLRRAQAANTGLAEKAAEREYVERVFSLTHAIGGKELTAEETRDMIEFLKRNVAAESWDDPRSRMDSWSNRLLVRHQAGIVQQVEMMLQKLQVASAGAEPAAR